MIDVGGPPDSEEFEFTLLGPGYGESIVMHIGSGEWIVVDSYVSPCGLPAAIQYLKSIGIEPESAVSMVVATHWHDDHIQGIAKILEACPIAKFCCASVLCKDEFLTLIAAMEKSSSPVNGLGLRELYNVFSLLRDRQKKPTYAFANRVVFQRDGCRLWALSPSDNVFETFLRSVRSLIFPTSQNKTRIPSLSPNKASVVLLVECKEENLLLLGADLERQGWVVILADETRPAGMASVFKIPHHGSKNANEPRVWQHMLQDDSLAVLTPWNLGGWTLPTIEDVKRILRTTPNAWVTNKTRPKRSIEENKVVEEILRESRTQIRQLQNDTSMVRLRRFIVSDNQWKVEAFGTAGRLVV